MGTPRTSAVSTLASGPGVAAYTQMLGELVKMNETSLNASAAATLRNPAAYANEANAAENHPLIVTQGSYLRLMGRWSIDAFSLGGPTIRVFGANTVPTATGTFSTGTIFWRLDAATFNAAGTAWPASAFATAQTDGVSYYYSELVTHNGMNLHGAKSVLVIIEVGASDVFELFGQLVNI